MSKRYSVLRCPVFIIAMVIVLGFFNLTWAASPEIYSITPDTGRINAPTQVTIKGSGFQPMPKAALYGGGPYKIGGCSLPARKMVTNGKIDVIYGYGQGLGYQRLFTSKPLERGTGYWILFSNTSEGAEFTASTSVAQ